MKKILFVCTGNTCRSPMAEAIFKNIIKESGREREYEAESAGIFAVEGQKASSNAVETMRGKGLDLTKHISKSISEDMIIDSDIILTMTKSHKDNLLLLNKGLEGKVFTIKEYIRNNEDIDILDPFGSSLEVYKACAEDLEKSIRFLVQII